MEDQLEIVMIGNRGVGKSSVLSAMWSTLDQLAPDDVSLTPNTDDLDPITGKSTYVSMRDKWQETLDNLCKQGPFVPTKEILKQPGSAGFPEYSFVFHAGKNKQNVVFVDSAGDYTTNVEKKLVNRVKTSLGVFCVIDASILMECNEAINNKYNSPSDVKRIIENVTCDDDGKQPSFLMFILTKCEKYMANSEKREELYKAFSERYENLVKFIKSKGMKTYYLPVQTIGPGIAFSSLDSEGMPSFRTTGGALKPVDVVYPLIVLFKHLIDKMADTNWFIKFLTWLNLIEDVGKYETHLQKLADKPLDFREL